MKHNVLLTISYQMSMHEKVGSVHRKSLKLRHLKTTRFRIRIFRNFKSYKQKLPQPFAKLSEDSTRPFSEVGWAREKRVPVDASARRE
jgi:hypothetical protein